MSKLRFQKLAKSFKNFGTVNALLYVCQRALARLPIGVNVVKYYLLAQPVPPRPKRQRPHALRIKQVSHEDYNFDWFPRPKARINARFAQNSVCFVAFKDDKPLACLWLKTNGEYIEDTVRCAFKPLPVESTAWDYDVFVQPEHRLDRTFMHMWNHAFEWMREHDIHWTMSRIDAFNLVSINSHKRLGAQITGSVVFWSLGSWQLALSSQSPRFSFSRTKVPGYTVNSPSR